MKVFLTVLSFLPWSPRMPAAEPLPVHEENRPLLAAVLVMEAGNDGYTGMRAVASVIRNRSLIRHSSLTSQVLLPSQFSCLNHVTPYGLIQFAQARHEQWENAMSIVDLLCAPDNLWYDETYGATHFENRHFTPAWTKGMLRTRTLKNHAFYKNEFFR